jgi:hypothetical protein
VSVIGFNDQAAYTVPADLFAQLAATDARRKTGTVGQVLLFAIGAEVNPLAPREELDAILDKVRSREIPSVITLFRLRVSEDLPPNTNPELGELLANGEPLAPGATLRLASDKPTPLELTAPDPAFETYTQVAPDGTVETKTEQLISAWYSTSGRFEPERVALRTGTPLEFRPPDGTKLQPFPENRGGTLWTVVRDTRGAQSWKEVPFYLCDERLPAPKVTSIETQSEGLVVLHGENLSSVLDVVLGGRALERGAYSPRTRHVRGAAAGGYALGRVRGGGAGQALPRRDAGPAVHRARVLSVLAPNPRAPHPGPHRAGSRLPPRGFSAVRCSRPTDRSPHQGSAVRAPVC